MFYIALRHCFKSDAERKLFTSVITNKLKEHGFELNIHDHFVAEMMEKERRDQVIGNNGTEIEESNNIEPAYTKNQEPPHIHVSKEHWNQTVPQSNLASTFHIKTIDRSEKQILSDSPNPNSKSSASSASYICGNCSCRNPILISDQGEDHTSLRKEVVNKSVHVPKEADDDSCDWKALYEHDVQNSYLMFETNPAKMVTSCENEHAKYQRWLKMQSQDRHLRSQECVDGSTSECRKAFMAYLHIP